MENKNYLIYKYLKKTEGLELVEAQSKNIENALLVLNSEYKIRNEVDEVIVEESESTILPNKRIVLPAFDCLKKGDILIVSKLDCFDKNIPQLMRIVDFFLKNEIILIDANFFLNQNHNLNLGVKNSGENNKQKEDLAIWANLFLSSFIYNEKVKKRIAIKERNKREIAAEKKMKILWEIKSNEKEEFLAPIYEEWKKREKPLDQLCEEFNVSIYNLKKWITRYNWKEKQRKEQEQEQEKERR